jgi:hypothetical protein
MRMRLACQLTLLGCDRCLSCSSHYSFAFSESLQPGPGPLPPLGPLAAGSRPAAAARLQPGPGVLRPGPTTPEAGTPRFPSRSRPGPARSRCESFPQPGRGPLAPRDSSPALASSSQVPPDLLTRFPSRLPPGRGPLPLRGLIPPGSRPAAAARLLLDLSVLWPGPARPEALHLASRVRPGPGLTPARTFAQGATALASFHLLFLLAWI